MKSRFLTILALLLLPIVVSAQTDTTFSDVSWFISVHSGGLFGKKGQGSAFAASAIQGVRYKRVSFGVGVGYDAYREWRTVPVFASAAYDLIRHQQSAWFLMGNTGFSKAWNVTLDEEQFIYNNEGGFFFHPQAGYRHSAGKFSLYITAGFKLQRISFEQTPRWWLWGHPGTSKITVDQDLQRVSVQIGIGLN